MPESRQLAVIMFTDIVGYTAMMQRDESQALIKMNRYRESLKLQVQEFNGELIQYFGDGGLAIFSNSADAVNCSTVLQNQFREEPQVPVRIGLHLGDILIKEGNIFGDCVNITSRIESMGIPGAVMVSELVQKQLKNRPQFKLISAMLGQAGIEMARQHLPDLILLDLHLPDLHGREVLSRLRRDETTCEIPVVIISADATVSQIKRLRAEGARDYLTKPFEMQDFFRIINEASAPRVTQAPVAA